jgi:hypothetical protein
MAKGDLGLTLSLEGAVSLKQALSGARVGDAKKAVKKKALEIVREARDSLRSKTPVRRGNLKRATKAKSIRGGGAVAYVDRTGGSSGKGYHIHIVDKGTKKRATKTGANRGTMAGINYVEPIRARAAQRVATELVPAVLEAVAAGIKQGAGK